MEKLLEKAKALPKTAGVYIMKGISAEVLYVGKAKNLSGRVQSYFNNSQKNLKTKTLVENIKDFEYILTNNELDAFALEINLIQKHNPFYNILLKDGKAYPYIKIDYSKPFPRLEIVRKAKQDKAKYCGPYFQGQSVSLIMDAVNSAFKIRRCKLNLTKQKKNHRPCINFDIGNCMAPCVGAAHLCSPGSHSDATPTVYNNELKKVEAFLRGNFSGVKKALEEKMQQFSDQQNFEEAMKIRDQLKAIETLKEHAVLISAKGEDIDAWAVVTNERTAFCLMTIRDGKAIGSKVFTEKFELSDDEKATYIASFYEQAGIVAESVLVDFEPSAAFIEYVSKVKGQKVEVSNPKIGKKFTIIKTAKKNALEYLEKNKEYDERKERLTTEAMQELQKVLGLKQLPMRIECFDNSHIGGTSTVASMTVFVGGMAERKHYRKFKLKANTNSDDYLAMEEVLTRRFSYLVGVHPQMNPGLSADKPLQTRTDISFSATPNLVVIDGGKGQLGVAVKVLKDLGLYGKFDVIAIAERNEEIFLPEQTVPVVLAKGNYALRLVQRIRDEAHRFAIEFHRNKRSKSI